MPFKSKQVREAGVFPQALLSHQVQTKQPLWDQTCRRPGSSSPAAGQGCSPGKLPALAMGLKICLLQFGISLLYLPVVTGQLVHVCTLLLGTKFLLISNLNGKLFPFFLLQILGGLYLICSSAPWCAFLYIGCQGREHFIA